MRANGMCGFALLTALLVLVSVPALAGDLYVPGTYATIQAAVDAAAASGDVIHVAAGTYREQVKIDGKSLDLVGAGVGSTILEAVDVGDRTTYSVTQWNATARTVDPMIGVVGPCTVNITDMTLDGRELGPDNFYGIHMFDADGSVTDCRIEDVLYAGSPGAQRVVSVAATHSATGTCTVDFSDNVLPNFQKGGLLVMGPDADCTVNGNDIDNAPSPYNAGNGIQISYGADGSLTGNNVTGVAYTGSDWAATGILFFECGDIDITGGLVDECQMGVNYSQWNWVYTHPGTPVITVDGVELDDCDWSVGVHLGDPGASIDLTVDDCNIHDGAYSGVDLYGSDVDPWGGGYYSGWTSGTMTAAVTNNTIACGDGIVEYVEVSGGTVNVTATGNDLSGCGDFGVYNNYSNTVDAEENYWGATDGPAVTVPRPVSGSSHGAISPFAATDEVVPHGEGGQSSPLSGGSGRGGGVNVTTNVDYSPWYAATPGTVPMDWGSDDSIQDALDLAGAGSTVTIEEGTYNESVAIPSTMSGGTLTGGSLPIITGGMTIAGGTDGLTVASLHIQGAAASNSVIRALGTISNITFDTLIVDGQFASGRHGYSGGQMTGDFTVTDCEFKELLGWSVCDTRSGSGGDGSIMEDVVFADNYFHDNNGSVVLRGFSGDFTNTVNIYGNTVDNIGGNNAEVGNQWAAFEVNRADVVNIYGNHINDVQPGSWGEGEALQLWGINTLNVYNNVLTNCGQGIWVATLGGTYPIPAGSIYLNTISGHTDWGLTVDSGTGGPLDAEMNWWGDASGPTNAGNPGGTGDTVVGTAAEVDYDPWIGKTGTANIVCDPDPQYLTVANPTQTVDVNYLGGGGGMVYGYSIKFSWDGALASTAPGSVTEGTLLSDAGSTVFQASASGANEITVDCAILGASNPGVTGPGTMFSIAFTGLSQGTSPIDVTIISVRDNTNAVLPGFYEDDGELIVDVQAPVITATLIENLTLAHTDDYIKDTDTARVTATVTDDDPSFGVANIVADLSGLGGGAAVNPDTYVASVATWTTAIASVACTPADGTVTVTVDATDPIGNPAAQDSDTIIADNTPPTAVTDFDATVAHEECGLSWTMGTDLYLAGVTVRRDENVGDYPLYPAFVGSWPAVGAFYPATEASGTEVYNGAGTTYTDGVIPRNIYYYQAFCYDIARNYGAAATTARDLSNNYWLGDIATTIGVWGYNGLVNDADIDKLGGTYFVTSPTGNNAECDVGPTVNPNGSRLGLPFPDAAIQFEDLMIFALNYGMVTPRIVPLLPDESTKALSLELVERTALEAGEVEIALRLEGNASEVKGISTLIEFDSNEVEFVGARLSDEMLSPIGRTFFWHGGNESSVQVDMAVLGTGVTLGGSGDVAILTFRVLADEYALDFVSADLRGADNEDLYADLEEHEAKPGVPMAFRLVGNTPNPFNPMTKIAFAVPHEAQVSVRVYDVTGRLVRTLVDGTVEPGVHEVAWDGRSDHGESVGSGVYFCTMQTADFHDSHKMMLLK